MAPATFTVHLTDLQLAALEAKATAAGIDVNGGTLPKTHGVTLSFTRTGNVVTFAILSKPFFATAGMISSGVAEFLAAEET